MADSSDDSDVNPSEMARMVQDLDDLDNTLLGGALKKKETFSLTGRENENKEVKKKVAFKDFDNDDPLADLLSDNDTSYEIKKPVVTKAKSNLVADLFGIKNSNTEEKISEPLTTKYNPREVEKIENKKEEIDLQESTSNFMNKKPSTAISNQGNSTSQNIGDKSWLNNEITPKMEDSQKVPNAKARKSTLMEDLFGSRARSAPTREIDASQNLSKLSIQNPTNLVSTEAPKSEQSNKRSSGYVMESGPLREPRRGRRNSPGISDPLGLFSSPKQAEPVDPPAPEVEKKIESHPVDKLPEKDLPEWLGGAAKVKEAKLETETKPSHNEKLNKDAEIKSLDNENPADFSSQKLHETIPFYPDVSTMFGNQFDQQSAIISMQQQEHELRTAATLADQNKQVAKIVENQKAKLDEQGKMFNVLIKHQIERQSMLETQMKIQQARIDHYIQTLMSQPTALPNGVFPKETSSNEFEQKEEKSFEAENLVKKLELENVHLGNTIDILKEKHEKEITILQESYEKQMLFLRQGMEKLEIKLSQDYELLDKNWELKFDRLKKEKDEMDETYRQEITRLKKNEKIFIEEIHDRHSHNVELLRKEHAETIDEISRAKEIERQAIDSITNHKTDLSKLFERSECVIESFHNLQKKIENKNEEFGETREIYLKKQEENLQLLRDQLNLQQDALANERKKLLEISQRLDSSTSELKAEFTKNSKMIDETEERLATKERILIREKQLFDEQMRWEREHLQIMKDAWIKEQERQMTLILSEREAVVNERTKLEILKSLKNGSEDMLKVELEAALKTAQEATNEAIQEKQRWQEKIRTLDSEKRSLREKEKHLIQRAKELESLTQSALKKRDEGLEALKEAKLIEERHKDQFEQLRIQLTSLAHRETRNAAEKIIKARERLVTKIYPAEKPEIETIQRISPNDYINEKSLISNSHVSTHFKDVVDPHLLLLKLNLDNKLDTTDELLADMQIVSQ